ncbi:Chitin synthase 6 [Orchesella cincta]|uniref:chitin synthase n=1 Tax=Orchesella cincta TaxID=48709 RepID=A0A1D2MSN2_ORCCI|nr:Chitin synthase 6 [Orchesella cincta]
MPSMRLDAGSEPEYTDDDESAPLTNHDIYSGSHKSVDTRNWDVFRNLPLESEEGSVEDQGCYLFVIKLLKVVAYLVTFTAVLGGAVLAKISLLLMTTQLEPDRTVPFCNKKYGRDKKFEASISEVERISWTWAILIAFLIPEIGAFIRSLRICVFKAWRKPSTAEFIVPLFFETCYAAGLALFVFAVLPSVNVLKAVMLTNCVCLIPGLFGMLSRYPDRESRGTWILKCSIDLLAVTFQISGLLVWPILSSMPRPWLLPLSGILISCGWWENYVDSSSPFGPIRALGKMRKNLVITRYFTYIFVSIWKMITFFTFMVVSVWLVHGNVSNMFTKVNDAFAVHRINVTEIRAPDSAILPDIPGSGLLLDVIPEKSSQYAVQYALFIQIFAAYICYIFGKFACKICIQGFSYAFPVSLAVPVTLSILIALCGLRTENACFWEANMPQYLFWSCPKDDFVEGFLTKEHSWLWLLWLVSQAWITIHIWTPKCERLASTERLFVTPMYSSLLVDQSLALNRKREDDTDIRADEVEQDPTETDYEEIRSIDSSHKEKEIKYKADTIPRIFACATMWHETKDEMMEMLKSIFRMDEDQCARRVALKYFEVVDPGYYEFETHIFFDDAFELRDEGSLYSPMIVNPFVKLLITCVEEAACSVHETIVRIRPPKKCPAPYGGRLEWILPGKTKMIAHLKDKGKIRHRKRWSQVMYMYYLLGHRLMELSIPVARKEVIAENTYLLTLDGDIDFHPSAVELLVDLMKKNRNLGAACGRIHPIGSGPMVWYQVFEYAIGHWLQKATEHMIGCVLCSPGCFSLFRGKALMDDNVMAKYTLKSDEPRHYVQYDQGEDRWLCTLLLQRGYRVEYSAASDAKTHCPEGFNEFYNQRRRWVPSTMANICDLLMDYKRTIKVNPDISMPYIIYQFMLMFGTILGPGTIFLMLVGAFVAAFRIDNWTSFYYNIIPIAFFMFVCFTCKSDIQLIFAQILSTVYVMVMMAVIVGTALQLGEDGIQSPSSIFLISLSSSFVIAALLHPQEFTCILPLPLYFLSIPSMYLLLIIYSLVNLNVVSWGTREVVGKKSKQELEAEKKEAEEAKKKAKKAGFLGFIPGKNADDTEGSLELSFAGLFKLMCCTHPKSVNEGEQLLRIADSLDKVTKRLDTIERAMDLPHGGRRVSTVGASAMSPRSRDNMDTVEEKQEDGGDGSKDDDDDETSSSETREKRDDLINPYWIEDRDLKRGEVDYLSGHELSFWKDLIEKYLKPIDADKQKEARIAQQLAELRDRSVFFFFMINAIFVLIVFLMQLNKDALHFKWPWGTKENVTFEELSGHVTVSKEYLQLEPIGLVFVAFFGLIIIIQFSAMLFHRFGTLSHILAATELTGCTKEVDTVGGGKDLAVQREGVRLIRKFQRLKNLDGDSDNGGMRGGILPGDVARRKTIHNLERQKNNKRQVGTLDVAFEKKFKEILNSPDKQARLFGGQDFQVTFQALKERRTNVLERRSSGAERKKSNMETLKGPIVPMNNGTPNGGTLNPQSGASRNRGKAPKPKVTSIDFNNGHHGVPPGAMNQGYMPDEELQLYSVQQSRRNSQNWRDPEAGGIPDARGIYDHLPRRNNSQM